MKPSGLRLAWRFARRELRGGVRGFRIFRAGLALGVGVIAAIGSEMEFTYRFASAAERAWMEAAADMVSEVAEFRSMAVVGQERALTQVKAADSAYPLIGAVALIPEMPLQTALAGSDGLPGAVMERVLSDRLGLEPGDSFRLGTQDFRLMAVIAVEPDAAASGFALGPKPFGTPACWNPARYFPPNTGWTCPRAPASPRWRQKPAKNSKTPACAGPMPATARQASRNLSNASALS